MKKHLGCILGEIWIGKCRLVKNITLHQSLENDVSSAKYAILGAVCTPRAVVPSNIKRFIP